MSPAKEEELVPASQDLDELIVAGDDDDPELRRCLLKVKELQHLLPVPSLVTHSKEKINKSKLNVFRAFCAAFEEATKQFTTKPKRDLA
ncbi:hypothetical protein S7711_11562 [Stachybotrys chartarum IBT 7711]|uniref:Uncharacterized protein n=1 Tax=Stachybotrys chartarum (strain CBS 109288 / IBT 7711) TaxID=1280523 RepID=A0A084AXL3_STACB|nr:hypothetical protein S7711_11562 [Stachybotrys chartarum IBT 7711]